MKRSTKRIIFLDRDGVINRRGTGSRKYVRNWDDVEYLPGVFGGLGMLARAGFEFIVFTNQMGIGLGSVSQKDVDAVHDRMKEEFGREGISLLGFYVCPHLIEVNCECRKPKPGLILLAMRDHEFDIAASYVIGDSPTDLIAGQCAGCANGILVKTGYEASETEMKLISPVCIAADLGEAAEFILQRENSADLTL